jgi:sugar lactone lactonase YvrE
MKIRSFALLLAIGLGGVCAWSEGTRIWTQSRYDEFEKGTADGVAIGNDGSLELAPAFRAIATTPSTFLWSIAAGPDGTVFLGAGAPARVYAVQADGKTSTIFEPQELAIQALVADKAGILYAATSPDGKVYRIQRGSGGAEGRQQAAKSGTDPGWTSSVFYEPKTKYIWALALDAAGQLYIATGDHGEVFRVDASGRGTVFFKSDEAQIRALAFDPQGNLIAGCDGSGLIYRISPRGEAFVLYSAAKKEITALAVDKTGNIYAAGAGDKRGSGQPPVPGMNAPFVLLPPSGSSPIPAQAATSAAATSGTVPLPLASPLLGLGALGSEVYRIAPDGSPALIWESHEDLVYAFGFDAQGRLTAGTGNKARIFLVQGERHFTDLLKASASQVTGFAPAPNGGLYVATSNLGKLFLLGGAPETPGTYESDVFDARTFSRWGRAEVRGQGAFELWARSGNVDNPDRNWSAWAKVDWRKGESLPAPAARFVQWKAVLRPGSPSSRIDSVALNYLPKNVAPVIEEVVVHVGARFQPLPRSMGAESVAVNFGPQPPGNAHPDRTEMIPSAFRDRDAVAVRWAAHDDNDDELVYSLYYRGEGETEWRLLKDKITDKFYSFEAGLLPDGGYAIKVIASDAPSNPPESALTGERESPYFEVDTTPPRIDGLKVTAEHGALHIVFRAGDTFSAIKRAEYAVDAGDWQVVEPVGHISDALTEDYDFTVAKTGTGSTEHLVVVRAWDKFDNMASAKTVVK